MSTALADWPRKTRGANAGQPRFQLQSELIDYWCLRIPERVGKAIDAYDLQEAGSLHMHGDLISHYAMTLGRIVRKPNGAARLVLLNGDSYRGASGWGTSTSSHQWDLRRKVEQTTANMTCDVLILPFSALGAAGLSFDSIKVIEALPDRTTRHEMSSDEPSGRFVMVESGRTEMVSEARHGYMREDGSFAPYYEHGTTYSPYNVDVERPIMVPDESRAHIERPGMQHASGEAYAELKSDGLWHWTVRRHWLGESIFRAHSTETRYRKLNDEERAMVERYDAARTPEREADARIRAMWHEQAQLNFKRRRFATVANDDRYDLPAAEQARYEELGQEIDAMSDVLRDCRDELAKHRLPDGYSSGRIAYTVRRWATYLSAFDYNEPHQPYFMCELPGVIRRDGMRVPCRPKTVAEALDDLMPDEVRQAIATGLDVQRQGDIFAIPTSMTTTELKSRAVEIDVRRYSEIGGVFEESVAIRSKVRDDAAKACVLGTNHAPTHSILTKDGDWYGRGRMYHVPGGWRTPDHRVQTLGDGSTWYRLVKNTVPLDVKSGSSRGSSSATVFQSGDSRAWTLGGMVD